MLRGRQCPQDIAYASGTLYFTNDEWIGGVSVDGSNARPHWLNEDAYRVTADRTDVFWTVGNATSGVIGRAPTDGRILNRRFIDPTPPGEEIALWPTR